MLANQASSTPPTTAASSDQVMQDGAGKLWTSLGQAPGLQMAWRRLPAFPSDMKDVLLSCPYDEQRDLQSWAAEQDAVSFADLSQRQVRNITQTSNLVSSVLMLVQAGEGMQISTASSRSARGGAKHHRHRFAELLQRRAQEQ
jgi:hypothetical protein